MSLWRDGADFMKDIESVSEFYVKGHHNNPGNKFVIKSRKEHKPVYTPWYESDSDEDDSHSFGRGKKSGNNSKSSGGTSDHLEVLKDIRMQVRSVVGNRYDNTALESYYNVCKDDDQDTPSCAPKEVSIIYAKEQNLKNSTDTLPTHAKKNSIANNIQQTAAKLTTQNTNSVSSSSSSSSPKKEYLYQRGTSKKMYGMHKNNPDFRLHYTSPKNEVNINSKEEFPTL